MPSATAYRLVRAPLPAPVPPELDAAQRAVVEHGGGPLLVLAGPGTGKTTTLVEAVVRRVERGAQPDEILVLTFSRKAADELRERIAARLGRTAAEPAAFTFHSWCYALVRSASAPDRLPRLLSQAERDVRVRELLAGHAEGFGLVQWPAALRPALRTRGFARECAALFDRARERGLDADELRRLGERYNRPAWTAVGAFVDEYLNVLDARGEVDYAGLVAAATELLQRPELGPGIVGRYRSVFVDEYQDTDPAQERLLQHLAGAGRDLVVVGDPDQSIYAFRGADVTAILEFPRRFPTGDGTPAPVIPLSVSRRSGAALLAASRAVAARITTPGLSAADRRQHRALTAAAAEDGSLQLRLFSSPAEEVVAVADLLRRAHLEDGLPWSSMAVLVRSGVRTIPSMQRALVAAGVPVQVAADEVPAARDPAVAPLLTALRIADAGDEAMSVDDARLLLLSPLGRALPSGLRALGRRLRGRERDSGIAFPAPSAVLMRAAVLNPGLLVAVDDWIAAPCHRLHRLLHTARDLLGAGGTPEQALWVLWEQSGWSRRLAADSALPGPAGRSAGRDLDAVVALFDAAARLEEREPRAGVATLLDELGLQEIPGAAQEERAGAPDAVRLLTAHRAKGLEWELVVVAGVQEEVWPDLRRRGSVLEADLVDRPDPRPEPSPTALLVDERRLFYVAVTRAKRLLVVTAVQSLDDTGLRPSRFLDELGVELPPTTLAGPDRLVPSSLVARLRRALQAEESSAVVKSAAARQLAALADATGADGEPLVPAADPSTWWGVHDWTPGVAPVRDADRPVDLSASSVAGYQACPLRWFLEHEVRARAESKSAQGFGTVVHALAQLVAEGVLPPDADQLLAQLDAVWSSLGFDAPWQREREREQAREALCRFVAWAKGNPRQPLAAEAGFEVNIGDVILRGSVDRLEIDADGRIHIVDFKTGRTPRRNEDVLVDPQLGVYQLVARAGGFDQIADPPGASNELGGAELVWLRNERAGGLPQVQRQPPLEGEPPTWADQLVSGTGEAVRKELFPARPGSSCTVCAFRPLCPAHDSGAQVVS